MNKRNGLVAFLAAAIVVSFLSAAEGQKEASRSPLQRAKNQVNESLDRLKRCMRGKCTKSEYAKGARDVVIASVAVITTMYGLGLGLEKVGWWAMGDDFIRGLYSQETVRERVGGWMVDIGELLQKPAVPVKWYEELKVRQMKQKFPMYSWVRFKDGSIGGEFQVLGYDKGYGKDRKVNLITIKANGDHMSLGYHHYRPEVLELVPSPLEEQ